MAKQKASVVLERILQAHDKQTSLLTQYGDTITNFKQSKNVQVFRKTKKGLDEKFKSCNEAITSLSKDLQVIDSEGSSKVRGGRDGVSNGGCDVSPPSLPPSLPP